MVTDLYAHTHNEDRRRLTQKVDEDFFQKRQSEMKKAASDEAFHAYQLLQKNPDIAKLVIAMLQKQSSWRYLIISLLEELLETAFFQQTL